MIGHKELKVLLYETYEQGCRDCLLSIRDMIEEGKKNKINDLDLIILSIDKILEDKYYEFDNLKKQFLEESK